MMNNTNANKVTKKDRFNELLAIEAVAQNEDLVAFINHEIELLTRKNAKSGESKKQKENAEIKEVLIAELATMEKAVTISEFQASNETAKGYSNQKIAALFKQLVEAGRVERIEEKGKALFRVAD